MKTVARATALLAHFTPTTGRNSEPGAQGHANAKLPVDISPPAIT